MIRRLTDYRSVTVSLTAGNPWTFVMSGNKRRRQILFANTGGVSLLYATNDPGLTGPCLMRIIDGFNNAITKETFGPILGEPVYVRSTSGNGSVTITEIFEVGK